MTPDEEKIAEAEREIADILRPAGAEPKFLRPYVKVVETPPETPTQAENPPVSLPELLELQHSKVIELLGFVSLTVNDRITDVERLLAERLTEIERVLGVKR